MKKIKNKAKLNSFGVLLKRNKDKELPTDFCLNICRGDVGFLFGPAKAGKSIFAENFAMNLASGRKKFIGLPINKPKSKVFYVSLEEDVNVRMIKRGIKQISTFNEAEIRNIEKNLIYSDEGFINCIDTSNDWKILKSSIEEVKPDIVIIDSINRFNKDIEKRKLANPIMEELRYISNHFNCSIILLHHTNKQYGNKQIDMHSMSGSSALSRNAEFFIGINKIENTRYVKFVVNRFSADEGNCKSFEINDNLIIDNFKDVEEYKLFIDNDGRYKNDNRKLLLECIQDKAKSGGKIRISTLKKNIVDTELMSNKTLYNSLNSLVTENKIIKVKHGVYKIKDVK